MRGVREEHIKWIRANPVAVGKQTDHFQSNLEAVLSWLTAVRLILYEMIYCGRGGSQLLLRICRMQNFDLFLRPENVTGLPGSGPRTSFGQPHIGDWTV